MGVRHCSAKWVFQALPDEQRFGLLFESVKDLGFDWPPGLSGTHESDSTSIGVDPDHINDKWLDALLNPIKPVVVKKGVSQQVIVRSADADLSALPILAFGRPARIRRLTSRPLGSLKTRKPASRTWACTAHRLPIKSRVIVNLAPAGQGTRNVRSYLDKGRPAPMAWVVGADPAVLLSSTAKMPYGVNEIEVAGGLTGTAVEMVQASSVDLLVPANAEFIIEGEVMPGETAKEGPFGEFAGYMGPVTDKPVAHIRAITHREDGIFYGFTSQMPPSESTLMQSLTNAGVLLKQLKYDLGEWSVVDAHIDLNFGGAMGHIVIAMEPRDPAHSKRVGCLLANMSAIKRVTVVDSDIDIRDREHVEWALNSRLDPGKDIAIVEGAQFAHMDTSVRLIGNRPGPASKLVLDATKKLDAGPFSLPSSDYMKRALDTWKQAGLPDFEIPKRAQLRIERA